MYESIELPSWADMQGLVASAYPHLDQAEYRLYTIEHGPAAANWLKHQLTQGHVTPALKDTHPSRQAGRHPRNINIAFTARGLEKLCSDESACLDFPFPFQEGIAGQPHRSRILGDTSNNSPDGWEWGGLKNKPVHVLLMVFAHRDATLAAEVAAVDPPPDAMTLIGPDPTVTLSLHAAAQHEHFGFMDGISQPILQGSRDAERYPESVHLTALGEIVCGYRNADGEESAAPALKGCTDFGRNGTYLVLRQLAQHVSEFWRFVYRASNASGANAKETAEALAAKVVGRWPDGTPLPPYTSRDDNEFGFAEDPHGYGCPLGSHIRRANPRDAFINTNLPAANPLTLNRHRVLRRGRSYGAKADDPLHATGGRGLFFMALNSDIERQFEFIQQNWINNPAFSGLRDERDPLVGDHDAGGGCPGFTIPALPAPARVVGLRRFVTVKGGQYFFLPGFKALNYLAKGDHAGP